jgi:hypothetical protein
MTGIRGAYRRPLGAAERAHPAGRVVIRLLLHADSQRIRATAWWHTRRAFRRGKLTHAAQRQLRAPHQPPQAA